MDATRTEMDFLIKVVRVAIESGASTINIPDTVGYTAPRESAEIIKHLLSAIPGMREIIISTHCHNDLGMATANSLAAVEAGARQIRGRDREREGGREGGRAQLFCARGDRREWVLRDARGGECREGAEGDGMND